MRHPSYYDKSKSFLHEQTILVDSGTTTIELINHLSPTLDYIQVVTHSFQVAALAARLPNVEVLMPGGMVRAYNMTLVGPQALSFLDTINADTVFLATTGFSVEYGVTNANILEVEVKRKITQRAEKVVLITDSSKYGKRQALQVVPMDRIDVLITDSDLDAAAAQKLADLAIEVVCV
jgi:DeoR/GlpR family transcriptional regulator of sugar metabolism